jgi:hypothetical protein
MLSSPKDRSLVRLVELRLGLEIRQGLGLGIKRIGLGLGLGIGRHSGK